MLAHDATELVAQMSASYAIGQIVHFVVSSSSHRPAIITRMWSHRAMGGALANLTLLLDDDKDERALTRMQESSTGSGPLLEVVQLAPLIWRVTGAVQDEGGRVTGTWHWPEEP